MFEGNSITGFSLKKPHLIVVSLGLLILTSSKPKFEYSIPIVANFFIV